MKQTLQKALGGLALAATMIVGASVIAPQSALADHNESYGSYNRNADARVTVDLNIRFGPSRDYYIVETVPRGRQVQIIRCLPNRDWCEVSYGRHRGWAASRYLYNTRYDRSYDRWDNNDLVIAFDFFANILDWNNDRRHRYDDRRWDDDYYRHVHQSGYRGDDEWRGRHPGHGNNHYDNGRHNGHYGRDRNDDRDHDWDRDRDRDYDRDYDRDRDGRWGR